MFVLDTDHLTLLEWGGGAVGQRLHERVGALPEWEGELAHLPHC